MLTKPQRIALVRSIRPVFDSLPGGNLAVIVGTRMRPQASVTNTNASLIDATGKACVRASGRYVRARIGILGEFSGLHGFDADVRIQGAR